MIRTRRAAAAVLSLGLAMSSWVGAGLTSPAAACACGAYAPPAGSSASVPSESALVSWGGGREDIWLSLDVHSDAATGALLFPVPDPHTTLSAGPPTLFSELATVTAPPATTARRHGDGNGAGAPNPGTVRVESRQRIGPLEVVVLTPTKPAALQLWLTAHGYTAKPQLDHLLAGYIAKGYSFVAARMASATAGAALDGGLDPIRLSFATGSGGPIYPERLSAKASEPVQLRLYTLTDRDPSITSANGVPSETYNAIPTQAQLAGAAGLVGVRAMFPSRQVLSAFRATLDPGAITDDYHFGQSDRPHARDELPAGGYSSLRAMGLGIVALLVIGTGFGLLARRARRAG